MSTLKAGCCIICAVETKTRCSSCTKAGIDIFFCSPAHQKLLWPLHRFFCGPGKANPFKWPPLLREEGRHAIQNLDTPPGPYAKGRSCRASTITEHLRDEAGLPEGCHVSQIASCTDPVPNHTRTIEMTAINVRIAEYRLIRSNTAGADITRLPSLVPPLTYLTQVADIFGAYDITADWLPVFLHRLIAVTVLDREASNLVAGGEGVQQARRLLPAAYQQFEEFIQGKVAPTHPDYAKKFLRELARLALEEVIRTKGLKTKGGVLYSL